MKTPAELLDQLKATTEADRAQWFSKALRGGRP